MGGWVAGLAGNIANSAQLKLKLGLSLAIKLSVIFAKNNTGLYWKEIFFIYGLMNTGSPTL